MSKQPLSRRSVGRETSTADAKHTPATTPKKPSLKERSRKLRLEAAAIHECAHAMAALHYEIPIGEDGLWVKWGNDKPSGFCDVRATAKYRAVKLSVVLDENPENFVAYLVGCCVGPIAEFYHLLDAGRDAQHILDKNKNNWVADFAAMSGIGGGWDDSRGCIAYTSDEWGNADMLFRRGFMLLFGVMGWTNMPDLPPLLLGETGIDIAPFHRNAIVEAATLVNVYDAEIRALATLLLGSPNQALTKEQIYEWAGKNFTRKNLREHIKEGDAA